MIRPEINAEMAVARAEMAAEMATMQPEIQRQMEGLKNFKGPDAQEMKRLQESLRGLGPEMRSETAK